MERVKLEPFRPAPAAYGFGGYRLDPARGVLANPQGREAGLRPKSAEVLRYLAEKAGRVVSREELMQAVWPDIFVTDDNITQCVAEIRRSLGDEGARLLRTLSKRGYLLAAEVTRVETSAPMVTSVPCDAIAEPTPRAPGQEGAPLSDPEPDAERRQLTLLFVDLVGPQSKRLDPEDLQDVVAAYRCAVAAAVERQEGYVAKYLGDWAVAYFGWPTAHEDDAERAVRAGLAVAEAVGGLRAGPLAPGALRARIGVATGPVVVGLLTGEGEAREQGVIGETPKRASELQAGAEPGAVMIDAATRRLTGALFDYDQPSGIVPHGPPGPERGSRVIGESRLESRFEALRGGATHLPPLGREEELDLLLRRWRQAQSGEGRVVLLRGEAGIGKSHLVAALQAAIAASGKAYERLDWFCSPQHQHSALHPIIARLERAAGFARGEAPGVRLVKLEKLLAYGAATTAEIDLVADLLGLLSNDRLLGAGGLSTQQRRERTLAALLRRVEALAKRGPVLGVLEDAHWADPTTLELLDLVVVRAATLPVLIVVTHRPEFRAPWTGQAHVTELGLGRLGRRDNIALIERVAGIGALPPEVVEDIVDRTDGVPLFVEELTRAMIETGGAAAASPASPTVPATLHTTLNARLDRLGTDARHAAQAGAAIGREFAHDMLAAVANMPDHAITPALRQLEDARLVHRRGIAPNAIYSFRHALLRDAAYGMLLREPRRMLHAHIAEAIARLHPDVAEREPQFLAWHYTRAGLADQAIEHWRRAGVLSVARFANLEAIGHFQQALEIVPELAQGERRDRLEAELRLAQAVPLIAVHGFGSEMVEACASRASELGKQLPDWPGRFVAHRLAWNASLMRREVPSTVALGRDLLSSAEVSGDPARVAIACRALGYSLFIAGEQATAEAILERGVAVADGLADLDFVPYGEDPRVICRIYLGQVHGLMGRPEAGLLIAGEGLALARAGSNPHAVAWALVVLSHLHVLLHDEAKAGRFAVEAIDVANQHRFPQWIALAQQWRGWALCRFGEVVQGLVLLEEGLRRLRETGAVLHATTTYCLLAEGCLLAGRPEAALAHVEAAHQHAEVYGERYLMAEIYRLRAEALGANKASAQEVEGQLRAALDTARHQAALQLELRAAASLARLWRERGRIVEARDLLGPVYATFSEGFAFPDLVEARALLEDLGAAPGGGGMGGASGIAPVPIQNAVFRRASSKGPKVEAGGE